MEFLIKIKDTDMGPAVEFVGGNLRVINEKVKFDTATVAEQYAVVAMAAIVKMSGNADKAEARLKGIILP